MTALQATADADPKAATGWRWAPAWVLAYIALWPVPGIAEAVLSLGAIVAIALLLFSRFKGGSRLLSTPAWALTSVLFFAYWLPTLISSFDAIEPAAAFRKTFLGLRYLPFLWLVAIGVATPNSRRFTFGGIAVIVAVWSVDALLQAMTGTSLLYALLDGAKHALQNRGMCAGETHLLADRLSGVLGPCNPKLGIVLASLSPFALYAGFRRGGMVGWLLVSALVGTVILLAGSRASWITYGLVLLFSGWNVLGWKKLAMVFAAGAVALVAMFFTVPQVRDRVERTQAALSANEAGMDTALSGRARIWEAAGCMIRQHPINGVGTRDFRDAFPACDPGAGEKAAWGDGPALHAHQIVLEILSETGFIGLLLWLAGAALAWRAWRYAGDEGRARARPAMLALAVTVFPLNTHLAFYSSFWGGVMLLLAALFTGSLLSRDDQRQ